ncbi:hypothetical protein FAIPA1_520006 [Frankia sp. AiPs1]
MGGERGYYVGDVVVSEAIGELRGDPAWIGVGTAWTRSITGVELGDLAGKLRRVHRVR